MLLCARQNPLAITQIRQNRFRISHRRRLNIQMRDQRSNRRKAIRGVELLHRRQVDVRGWNSFTHQEIRSRARIDAREPSQRTHIPQQREFLQSFHGARQGLAIHRRIEILDLLFENDGIGGAHLVLTAG